MEDKCNVRQMVVGKEGKKIRNVRRIKGLLGDRGGFRVEGGNYRGESMGGVREKSCSDWKVWRGERDDEFYWIN